MTDGQDEETPGNNYLTEHVANYMDEVCRVAQERDLVRNWERAVKFASQLQKTPLFNETEARIVERALDLLHDARESVSRRSSTLTPVPRG